jgi:hypothetical protein
LPRPAIRWHDRLLAWAAHPAQSAADHTTAGKPANCRIIGPPLIFAVEPAAAAHQVQHQYYSRSSDPYHRRCVHESLCSCV